MLEKKNKNAKCTSCQYWFTCDKQDQSKLECEWYKPLKAENYSDKGVKKYGKL